MPRLSIPELAFVVREARGVWKRANASNVPNIRECGRVRLIGVPRGQLVQEAIAETEPVRGEATFHIYIRGSRAKRGGIVWAKVVKPVTFKLPEFESEAFQAAARADIESGAEGG